MIASPERDGEFTAHPEDIKVDVLNYPFLEARTVLRGLSLDPSFYLSTTTASEAEDMLREGGFGDGLVLPTTGDRGEIDFDHIHVPVLEEITERNSPGLPGLSDFEHRYPTQGSTEAIKGLMARWSASGEMTELGYVAGEYGGYWGDAIALGLKPHEAPSLADAGDPVKGRVWFISNPSAVDGNLLDSEQLEEFIAQGHEVVLDYAYGGLTPNEHEIDVSAPNILAVLTSPSKIFGVFRQRYPGIAYTRQEVSTLAGSEVWFKSVSGLMTVRALNRAFEPHELPGLYQERQLEACAAIGRLVGDEFDIKPSDNVLMAHADELPEGVPMMCIGPRGTSRYRLSRLFELLDLHESGDPQQPSR